MFVVIEGPDAAGKNTQTKRLVARFTEERFGKAGSVGHFSFPRYETPLGEAILRHLKREIQTVEEDQPRAAKGFFRPAPEDAMIFQCMTTTDKYAAAPEIRRLATSSIDDVVCDRYWQSALVYGATDGLPRDWLLAIHTSLPQADLNIFIDLPLEDALVRRPDRRDRYEKDLEKQAAVRHGYRELWQSQAEIYKNTCRGGRWVTIDGRGTIDEVHERIWQQVIRTKEALGQGFSEQLDGGAP